VEVRHDEGVAIHIDPEPCTVIREDGGEASAGERIGQPLSRERSHLGVPTLLDWWKATWTEAPARASGPIPRGQRPWHVRTLLVREPGYLQLDRLQNGAVRIGKARSRSR